MSMGRPRTSEVRGGEDSVLSLQPLSDLVRPVAHRLWCDSFAIVGQRQGINGIAVYAEVCRTLLPLTGSHAVIRPSPLGEELPSVGAEYGPVSGGIMLQDTPRRLAGHVPHDNGVIAEALASQWPSCDADLGGLTRRRHRLLVDSRAKIATDRASLRHA